MRNLSQLFISESGTGQTFAINLINNLFESNMLIASQSKRNRIIITTKGYGMDSYNCQGGTNENGGPLCYFLMNMNNIFDVFKNESKFEYDLMKTELDCNPFKGEKIYSVIYRERDFRNLLANKFESRGATPIKNENEKIENNIQEIKNYAIVIGTNDYDEQATWSNLINPINDAKAVENILKSKYNYTVEPLYNLPLDTILMAILKIKKSIKINDNLLIFIAGHGYYDKDFSDCFIVFRDSKALNEDFKRNSYLQIATLNRLLDEFLNKKIFVIFDICFGAYFDLNAKDLSLSDYKDLSFDISLDEFIDRKNEYISRIYLSSGKDEVYDYWTNFLDHSPFPIKLINILEKESSFLTPGKIYKNIEGNITEPVLKYFGKHDTRGDFIMKVK